MTHLIKFKNWEIKKCNVDKLLYLLIDKPDKINSSNDLFWGDNGGKEYRDYDLPAIIWRDGYVFISGSDKDFI